MANIISKEASPVTSTCEGIPPFLKSALKPRRSSVPVSPTSPQNSATWSAQRNFVRSKSAPSSIADMNESSESNRSVYFSSPPKAVHFPSDSNTLACVRTFRKHGKPITVSRPLSDTDTETETEGDGGSSSASCIRYEAFNRCSGSPSRQSKYISHPTQPSIQSRLFAGIGPQRATRNNTLYKIDPALSSPIPSHAFNASDNVHLESLQCSDAPGDGSTVGTVLVRNISYVKDVGVRFTLDDWATVSNVSAKHVETLSSFPLSFFQAPTTLGDMVGLLSLVNRKEGEEEEDEWDRFRFTLRLEHAGLQTFPGRFLWLAVHCSIDGNEWWDNNGGRDYKVAFVGVKQKSGLGVKQRSLERSEVLQFRLAHRPADLLYNSPVSTPCISYSRTVSR